MAPKTRRRTGKATEDLFQKTTTAEGGGQQGEIRPPTWGEVEQDSVVISYPLFWEGYEGLSGKDQQTVQEATQRIKRSFKTTRDEIFNIGRNLIEVKRILPTGQFGDWLKVEFDLTERMAQRMMNVYERFYGRSDIMSETKLGPTVLYYLAAPSTPDEAIDDALQEAQTTSQKTVTLSRAEQLVRERREQQMQRELKQLNRFSSDEQDAIADRLENKQAKSFFQARKQHILESGAEHRDVEVLGPEVQFESQIKYHSGYWKSILATLPDDLGASFMFVECPLRDDFLPEYEDIAAQADRLLRVGGRLIVNASQRNILFVGNLLEPPLIARLCFNAHLRYGQSTPQPGLNYWQSWMPMALAYKEKWKKPPEMVDTSRSSDVSLEESMEKAADYYTRSYTRQGETVIHVVTDRECYNLSRQMVATAKAHNLGRLVGVGVSGP